jgi:putative hemolysin
LDPATIAGLILCLLVSIFCTATDSSLAHFSRSGLDALACDEAERERIRRFLDRRHDYQLACFALNSACNILFVILLTNALLKVEHSLAQLLAALAYSLLFILLVGDVIPRAWGEGNADRWLHRAFPVVPCVALGAWPLTAVLGLVNAVIGRLAGVPMERSSSLELSDEIRSVVSAGEKSGELQEEEREMIASIFELHGVEVAQIMTPRTDMVCIEADALLPELRTLAIKSGYSRIPIFDTTRDNIVGIVHVKNLLVEAPEAGLKARDVAQKPYFIPETKKVHELLRELRAQKVHLAIALDEYGGTAGLVTLEDVVEEIVGEIEDEYDEEAADPLHTIDDHTAECTGRLPIAELNDALSLQIPEHESYDTVAGFLSTLLGHIPAKGETLRWRNIELTVLDATLRKIRRVRVAVQPERADEPANRREP